MKALRSKWVPAIIRRWWILNSGFKSTDFEPYLLKTMLPPFNLLDSALANLGRSCDEMMDRAERIARILHLGCGTVAELKGVLSPLANKRPHDPEGEAVDEFFYRIPAWSDFLFRVEYHEAQFYYWIGEFRKRTDGGEVVAGIPGAWNFLEGEVDILFRDVEEVDGWGHYHSFTATSKDAGVRYFVRFSWGLLQEITPI